MRPQISRIHPVFPDCHYNYNNRSVNQRKREIMIIIGYFYFREPYNFAVGILANLRISVINVYVVINA